MPLLIHQPSYSMFNRWIEDDHLLDTLEAVGAGCIAFSPLAQGLLTDRYLQGVPADSAVATGGAMSESMLTDEAMAKVRALDGIARRRGQTLAQLALVWALRDPRMTSLVIGARPAWSSSRPTWPRWTIRTSTTTSWPRSTSTPPIRRSTSGRASSERAGLRASRRQAAGEALQPGDPAPLDQHGVALAERAEAGRARVDVVDRCHAVQRRPDRDHRDAERSAASSAIRRCSASSATTPSSAMGPSTATRRRAGTAAKARSAGGHRMPGWRCRRR